MTATATPKRAAKWRIVRVGAFVRPGDQFQYYAPLRWREVDAQLLAYYGVNGHFDGIPEHYRGRFRRRVTQSR